MQSLATSHQQTNVQLVSKQRLTLERLPTSFIDEHDKNSMIPWISLWPVGVNCPSCVPSKPRAHPQPTLCGVQSEEQRRPRRCASTSQEKLKHLCVINIVLVMNPKSSTVRAAVKQANSIPARPSVPYFDFAPHPQWLLPLCIVLLSGAKYRRCLTKRKVPFYPVEGNRHA